jgi:hypothetical protein
MRGAAFRGGSARRRATLSQWCSGSALAGAVAHPGSALLLPEVPRRAVDLQVSSRPAVNYGWLLE